MVKSRKGMINLTCLISLITMLFFGSCGSETVYQETINEVKKESVIQVDLIGDSQFICFTPVECQVEYVVEYPPSTTDSTILFCAAASFTGARMNGFKHSNICGTYVVDSMIYNRHFNPTTNIDASFAYWGGRAYFAKGKSPELLDSALQNNGVFFMQKQVLCDGKRGVMNLTKNTFYRVLAEYKDKLCVIQTARPMTYDSFVVGLVDLGIKDAIYLDMGGWKYSWYRNSDGHPIEIFTKESYTKYQTNWIVFRRKLEIKS